MHEKKEMLSDVRTYLRYELMNVNGREIVGENCRWSFSSGVNNLANR